MPSEVELKAIMPALPVAKLQALLPFLQQAIEEFGPLAAVGADVAPGGASEDTRGEGA